MATEFRILGPLEVLKDGRPMLLGSRKQRALLAALLVHANEVVSAERLIDDLWSEDPPPTALKTLRAHVSRLRSALEVDDRRHLQTVGSGYVLRTEPDEVDRDRFERLLADARRSSTRSDPQEASALLAEGLRLWRGPALADLAYEPFAQAEIARLEELRLIASQEHIEAELALGHHSEVVGQIGSLVREHPFRERLSAQLMLALYRCGRQAEALQAFRETRAVLVEELGIEPGLDLRDLEAAILRQDPSLHLPTSRALVTEPRTDEPAEEEEIATAPPTKEVRKTVTVVFCDVVESTGLAERLDPEALRQVMSRYFDTASQAFRTHGGTVEKFIGDAVMAVFGIPTLHEDDALRAVRAAWLLKESLATLNEELDRIWGVRLEVRLGLNTGEVVAGEISPEQGLVSGDPVNTAARLQQAAAPGEIIIGEATYALVADAVDATSLDPMPLRGKGAPVAARRLHRLMPGEPGYARRLDAPLVGRRSELAQLRQALDRATREQTAFLFTVIGPPGIGKTRLAIEFSRAVAGSTKVLSGRCLPYGEGITYWPLRELLQAAFGDDPLDGVRRLLQADEGAVLMVDQIGAAIGLSDVAFTNEEIFWATRKVLEALARDRPLLLILEDIHWAEPTFLDLVEHVADLASKVPITLLCLARPELLEVRSSWGGGKLNSATILLEPLTEKEAALLLRRLAIDIGERRVDEILRAAEGNPLFLEQLLASSNEDVSDPGLPVPPTIQALIAARIDRLGPGERAVLEGASIMGREFWQAALADLLPQEAGPPLPTHLEVLVRKQFIRPERPSSQGGPYYRFRHLLIQSTTYAAIPKKQRADLHERFAAWMERRFSGRIAEVEEILGYHLEQAYRCREQLGTLDGHTEELAVRAAERLAAGGRGGLSRGDASAAASLLGRAIRLLVDITGRLGTDAADTIRQLHLDRGRALAHLGDVAGARADLEEALAGARRADDRALEMKALNELGFLLAGAADYRAAVPLLEHSLRLAEGLGDRAGEVNALARLSIIDTNRLRFDRALESGRRALSLARAQKDTESIALALDALEVASVMIGDMTSVDRTARELVEIHRRRGNLWYLQFAIYQWCWVPLAAGRWDEATARVEEAWAINREIGDRGNEAMYPATLCWIARSRGEYGRSLAYGRQGLALAEEVDHAEFTAWSAGVLGWTLLELFANEEASTALSRSLEAADRAGARLELPRALGNLALVRWHEGDLEGAREIALRGDSTLAEVTTPPGRAYLQGADGAIALARTHIEMGELEVAEASLSAVLDAAGSAGWEEVTACAALALAEARVDTDPSLVERALEIATNVGLAGVTWRARTALATGLLTQGRRAEAEREIALSRKAVSALSASIEDENIKRSFRQGATAVIECSREAGDERDGDPPLHDPG